MSNEAVALALGEALSWLETQGLLMRNPTQPNAVWYVLTRRGRELNRKEFPFFWRP